MPNQRKRRKKNQLDLRKILIIFGSVALVLFVAILLIPTNKGYDDFLDALGFRESTDNYALVNSYGYMGRYQMGGEALQEAGFKDAEGNWTRSEDATIDSWSSEATSVVLDDGTVRMFYRDGSTALRYTDYVWSEAEGNYVRAATEVNTTAIVDSGCQLTAIKYSQQIDGKDVILVAGPTSSRRINGYIYTFLVNEDNSMELAYAYNITPDFYAYSCLTEMANGDIALLWESNGSALTFSTYKMADLTARRQDVRLSFNEMELLTGDTKTVVDKTGYYPDADLSELDTDVATVELSGSEAITDAAQLGSNANYAGDIIDTGDCFRQPCLSVPRQYHRLRLSQPRR